MEYAATDLNPRDRYKILTAFVLPRPIAWVTTLGPTGVVNAAPFSFFNVFGEDPPIAIFSADPRGSGGLRFLKPKPHKKIAAYPDTFPT